MTTVKDIAMEIEKIAPLGLAEEWDNVGLMVGDYNQEVKKVLTCLDVDIRVVSEAVDKGCNMICSHHPLIFSRLSSITSDTVLGKILLKAMENKVAIYSAHTNLDCAKGGTNDFLCSLFELSDVEILSEIGEGNLIRKGTLKKPIELSEMAKIVAKKLGQKTIKIIGDKNKVVSTVAICSGGGGDYIGDVSGNCDLYITGDIKYHMARKAYDENLCVIVAEHYNSEIFAKEILKNILKDVPVEVLESQENKDVYNYIEI